MTQAESALSFGIIQKNNLHFSPSNELEDEPHFLRAEKYIPQFNEIGETLDTFHSPGIRNKWATPAPLAPKITTNPI